MITRLFLPSLAVAIALPQVQQPEPARFAARAEVVVLHVIVKDRSGAHVSGLPVEAFSVVEDGRSQPIQFFAPQDAPATVGLLVDSSGSMAGARQQVAAAAAAFVETSHPQDDVFALGFNEHVWPALPPAAPFTSDPNVIRRALDSAMSMRGRTALHDAILEGLAYVERGRHERKALVVVSDGGDNASAETFDEVRRRVLLSNAAVYTVAFVDPVARDVNPARLRQIAGITGAEAFEPKRPEDVGQVFGEIARDIRHAYTIGYAPAESGQNGRLREVRVHVRAEGYRHLSVRTRRGYVLGGR